MIKWCYFGTMHNNNIINILQTTKYYRTKKGTNVVKTLKNCPIT